MAQILDLGKIRFQFKGEWSVSTEYQFNDVVSFKGNAYVYISTARTTGTLTSATTFWGRMANGVAFSGLWDVATEYGYGSVVRYGSNLYMYSNLVQSTGNIPTDTDYWTLFVGGWNFRSEWDAATAYKVGDSVSYGATVYVANVDNTNINPGAAGNSWARLTESVQWEGIYDAAVAYQLNDVVNYNSSLYIAVQNTTGNTPSTDGVFWESFLFSGSLYAPDVYYVTPAGSDTNNGETISGAFATIKAACAAAAAAGNPATINVSAGTYTEICPIVVPPDVAIVGDSQRTVNVHPTPLTNTSTMFQMSNGSILNKMTFKGMTGWVPGSTPEDITTSTPAGVVVGFNVNSPATTKSPYVLECAAICSGAIGALVDGSVHGAGAKSMLFHGYTIISDNGVGFWTKDGGKAEIVSCFTYYCYMGYAASGGGFIRSLNGNNSYGTWGATSRGFDANETPQTGQLHGQQLNFIYGGGAINVGDTVTSSDGGTATVTNVQISADKVYVSGATGTFLSGNTLTFTSGGAGTVGSAALEDQKGFIIVADNLSAEPIPGQSIQIADDSITYVIQSSSGTYVDTSSQIAIYLAQEKVNGSPDGTGITMRSLYSQVRLTGHDFLNIGTGGIATTNYPGEPTQAPAQGNEVDEVFPGRVYYVSTDQNGNFRVGEYFRIDQATGRATLNASAFDLAGLTSLRLGSIGAQLGETINEFSSDPLLNGNSNTAVPTEYAVKTYIDAGQATAASSLSTGLALKQNTLVSGTDIKTINSGSLLGSGDIVLVTLASVQALSNKTFSSALLDGDIKESVLVSATAANGTINFDALPQQIVYYTSNATGNFTINLRGDSSTTLNSLMDVGETLTVVFVNTCGGTAYYNTSVQIDGAGVTPKWQGGAAPTEGNASSIDIYSYVVIKTGSGTYTVLASQTQFA
jgi:hypothetical protein